MRLTMLSRAFFALLFAAAAGWESGKTCTTDDVRTLAKKDAKLSGATSSPAASPWATTWASCHLRSSGTDPTASITSR